MPDDATQIGMQFTVTGADAAKAQVVALSGTVAELTSNLANFNEQAVITSAMYSTYGPSLGLETVAQTSTEVAGAAEGAAGGLGMMTAGLTASALAIPALIVAGKEIAPIFEAIGSATGQALQSFGTWSGITGVLQSNFILLNTAHRTLVNEIDAGNAALDAEVESFTKAQKAAQDLATSPELAAAATKKLRQEEEQRKQDAQDQESGAKARLGADYDKRRADVEKQVASGAITRQQGDDLLTKINSGQKEANAGVDVDAAKTQKENAEKTIKGLQDQIADLQKKSFPIDAYQKSIANEQADYHATGEQLKNPNLTDNDRLRLQAHLDRLGGKPNKQGKRVGGDIADDEAKLAELSKQKDKNDKDIRAVQDQIAEKEKEKSAAAQKLKNAQEAVDGAKAQTEAAAAKREAAEADHAKKVAEGDIKEGIGGALRATGSAAGHVADDIERREHKDAEAEKRKEEKEERERKKKEEADQKREAKEAADRLKAANARNLDPLGRLRIHAVPHQDDDPMAAPAGGHMAPMGHMAPVETPTLEAAKKLAQTTGAAQAAIAASLSTSNANMQKIIALMQASDAKAKAAMHNLGGGATSQ